MSAESLTLRKSVKPVGTGRAVTVVVLTENKKTHVGHNTGFAGEIPGSFFMSKGGVK